MPTQRTDSSGVEIPVVGPFLAGVVSPANSDALTSAKIGDPATRDSRSRMAVSSVAAGLAEKNAARSPPSESAMRFADRNENWMLLPAVAEGTT